MEYWAHAGGLKNEINKELNSIKECKPQTYGVYDNQTIYDNTSLKAMVLIIQTAEDKKPTHSKLGFDGNYEINNQTIFNRNHSFYGHIIRNMRIIWGSADLISAYFYINKQYMNKSESILYFNITLSGCKTIESLTQYQILIERKQALTYDSLSNLSLLLNQSSVVNESHQLKCNWGITINDTNIVNLEESNMYSLSINKSFFNNHSGFKTRHKFNKVILTYIKGSLPDISLLSSIKPQTHLANHKTNPSFSLYNSNYRLNQNYFFYSNPIAIIEDGSVFEIDSPEAFLYNGNDLTLSYSIYSTNAEFAFNKTKIIPFAHLTPSNRSTITKISQLTFNISVGIFISTSDYGHNDIMIFIDKEDSFLLFYPSNEIITAEVILDNNGDSDNGLTLEPIKINCILYKTLIKKYYVLCDNMFENSTIGSNITSDVLREKILNSHIKIELDYLNMTLYTTFTVINPSYMGKSSDIIKRGNYLICNSNPSINYQIDYLNERNISTDNLTQVYYDKNIFNYNIKIKKISNYHYIVSLDILNYKTMSSKLNGTIALVFPLNDVFVAGNYSSLKNVHLYLNESLTNTRLIGKGVYIINIDKDIPNESFNSTYLRQIIMHRFQKEYHFTICSIDNESNSNRNNIQIFFNTHTKRIPKPSAKFMITIGLVSTGSVAIVIIAIFVIICLIQRYKRRGYSSVSSKKTIEFEQ